ncbi:hypothetical protein SDC9_156932 [bioreactor metagenome]|uniref:Uncharacterized protein n=1 Tax=bioreactor metagenome TaxID=1076179 RepID=A0A645F5V1_9ZZZZ
MHRVIVVATELIATRRRRHKPACPPGVEPIGPDIAGRRPRTPAIIDILIASGQTRLRRRRTATERIIRGNIPVFADQPLLRPVGRVVGEAQSDTAAQRVHAVRGSRQRRVTGRQIRPDRANRVITLRTVLAGTQVNPEPMDPALRLLTRRRRVARVHPPVIRGAVLEHPVRNRPRGAFAPVRVDDRAGLAVGIRRDTEPILHRTVRIGDRAGLQRRLGIDDDLPVGG